MYINSPGAPEARRFWTMVCVISGLIVSGFHKSSVAALGAR